MDKPVNLSMRDYLVRTLAVKMMVSEKVIDTVVAHQFSEANEALRHNDSIEISGFGKFFFNKKKAVKKLETMHRQKEALEKQLANTETTEHRKNIAEQKISSLTASIEHLKPRIND
jgi:nucleoid DNA-binding protein